MHGIVHKTVKEYVVDRSDEDTWETIVERAGLEPSLYLPISHYDDEELDAILETVSEIAVQDRPQIERHFGRRLAPELLSTFNAHISADWDLVDLLEQLERVTTEVDAAATDSTVPDLSHRREGADVFITYRSDRSYCSLAHGILEGLVSEYETDGTVTKVQCSDDGENACQFRLTLELS
ncbi:heme NO-binding domain-containing protein [Natrialbaceae archaeon A-arb3/5]